MITSAGTKTILINLIFEWPGAESNTQHTVLDLITLAGTYLPQIITKVITIITINLLHPHCIYVGFFV